MQQSIIEGNWFQLRDGQKMYYLDWRNDSTLPAIVTLHGSLTTCRTWDFMAQELGEFRVICPDLRGFGESAAFLDTCSITNMVEDIKELIIGLELAPCYLVGYSMGSRVAGKFCITYPDLITGLVLVDTSDFAMNDERRGNPAELALRPDVFKSWEELVNYLKKHEGIRWEESWIHHHARTMTEVNDAGWFSHKVRTKVLVKMRETINPDFFPFAYKISCPTLIMRGADSTIFTREEADFLARAIERSQLVEVTGAGHFIMQEQFGAFMQHVRAFLSSVEANKMLR
ncbi:MAG: alpha/beta fold hydrolase [Bacillota bacterium]